VNVATFVKVASVDDIPVGTGRGYKVMGKSIAVFNVEGEFHAIDGSCPHQGGPLGEGYLKGTVVTCPLHFWQFDVVRGHSPDFPDASIDKFKVKVDGQDVLVEV